MLQCVASHRVYILCHCIHIQLSHQERVDMFYFITYNQEIFLELFSYHDTITSLPLFCYAQINFPDHDKQGLYFLDLIYKAVNMSHNMRFLTMWYWDQQSLRSACAYAQSDQSLCLLFDYSVTVKLNTI